MIKYYTELHQLYRYYDEDDLLLYVGITSNTEARHRSHAKDKHWMHWSARSEYVVYDSREQLVEAERQTIFDEKPLYNVVHNRVRGRVTRIRNYEKTKPKMKRRRLPKVKQLAKKERDPIEDVLMVAVVLATISFVVCLVWFGMWFIKSYGLILFSFLGATLSAFTYLWCTNPAFRSTVKKVIQKRLNSIHNRKSKI